jgi:hypothetical protein
VICADELGPVIPRTFPPAPGWSPGGHRIKAPLEYSRGPEKTWVYGGLRVTDGRATPDSFPRIGLPDDQVGTEIRADSFLDAKLAALKAHASQIIVDGPFFHVAGFPKNACARHRVLHATISFGHRGQWIPRGGP